MFSRASFFVSLCLCVVSIALLFLWIITGGVIGNGFEQGIGFFTGTLGLILLTFNYFDALKYRFIFGCPAPRDKVERIAQSEVVAKVLSSRANELRGWFRHEEKWFNMNPHRPGKFSGPATICDDEDSERVREWITKKRGSLRTTKHKKKKAKRRFWRAHNTAERFGVVQRNCSWRNHVDGQDLCINF